MLEITHTEVLVPQVHHGADVQDGQAVFGDVAVDDHADEARQIGQLRVTLGQ